MLTAGLIITALAGLGIFVIGVLYLVKPRMIAANFGLSAVPAQDATAWLRIKGVRDTVTGIVAFVLLLTAPTHVIAWALTVFALIPLGDAVTILSAGGSRMAAVAIHGLSAILMLIGATLLFVA